MDKNGRQFTTLAGTLLEIKSLYLEDYNDVIISGECWCTGKRYCTGAMAVGPLVQYLAGASLKVFEGHVIPEDIVFIVTGIAPLVFLEKIASND